MTILGKILVILNLVFALVVGGFIVVVYARSNIWEDAYKKEHANWQAAQAAAKENADEVKKSRDAQKTFEADVVKRLDEEAKIRKDLEQKLDASAVALRKANETVADKQREVVQYADDVSRMQKEKTVLETALAKRDEQNKQLLADYNKLNQEATSYRLQNDSLRDKTIVLFKQLKTAEDLLKQKGTSTVGTDKPAPSVPPTNVEGLVTQVDEQRGLMSISIGSDSGIEKGQTLDAYRFEGGNAKYLGTIHIMDVRAKEAVARPEKTIGQLRVGDRVGRF